jgi:NADH-quinone oxidoreductase subunit C
MRTFDELLQAVNAKCAHGDAVAEEAMTPKGVRIPASDLKNVCADLHRNPSMFFDMLSCISVVDNGPEAGTLDVIYNLYSIPFNHHLALKVVVARDGAEIDTVEDIWKTANWHEREAFDMFGIRFKGHSDLRRILMPADWEGYPLRKDYKQQEYYRNIKLDY